jgi:hypothetical protein
MALLQECGVERMASDDPENQSNQKLQLKRILNKSEELTHERLLTVCRSNGSAVYPKMRIADVIAVERGGLSREETRFGLQAHFDFVAVDDEQQPLFVVEFDGPSHSSAVQKNRDKKKERLCRLAALPMLRVDSHYLVKHRHMDLLTWFVEVWYTQRAFDDAQGKGLVAWDEGFDPFSVASISSMPEPWPLWLSRAAIDFVRTLHKKGAVIDPIPCYAIGKDEQGSYRGIAWLRLTEKTAILAASTLRSQLFDVDVGEALEQLVVLELHERLRRTISGTFAPQSAVVVERAVTSFRQALEPRRSATVGNFGGFGIRWGL